MPSAPRLHLAFVTATAGLLVGGCGTGSATWHPQREAAGPPGVLQLPAEIRPLPPVNCEDVQPHSWPSAPAQYQQAHAHDVKLAPRILDISTISPDTESGPIRQPQASAAAIVEPPAAPSPRSEFVPIAMPERTEPPASAEAPLLMAQPTFSASQPTTSVAAPDGPQLASPAAVDHPPPAAGATNVVTSEANAGPSASAIAMPPASQQAVAPPPAAPPPVQPTTNAAMPNSPAMQIVAQRAMQIADQASVMAQRGMFYSARSELLQALQFIAQALDVQQGNAQHATALAAGLTALAEARDFSTQAGRPQDAVNVAAISAAHRTPLSQNASTPISPVVAQQRYFAYAQAQLTAAVAGCPAGSQVLYRLGRLQTAMSAHDADPLALHAPQAIVFHQAALATDGQNWLAANELGVLYARYGDLASARQFLVHSVSVHSHLEGWQNLAIVHRRLGETDLAERAERERQLLAQKSSHSPAEAAGMVRWVDTKTFAASGPSDVRWPADATAKTVAAASSTAARR